MHLPNECVDTITLRTGKGAEQVDNGNPIRVGTGWQTYIDVSGRNFPGIHGLGPQHSGEQFGR